MKKKNTGNSFIERLFRALIIVLFMSFACMVTYTLVVTLSPADL